MTLWAWGFLVGLIVVLVVALLLIGILLQARRIHGLAKTAAVVVAEVDENTRSIWSLATTNEVAKGLLDGAKAIDSNAAAIVSAVSQDKQSDSAA